MAKWILILLLLPASAMADWFGYPEILFIAGPEKGDNGQVICARAGDYASTLTIVQPIWRSGHGMDAVMAATHASCMDGPDMPSLDIMPMFGIRISTERLFR